MGFILIQFNESQPKADFASQFCEHLQPTSFANVLYADAGWFGLACRQNEIDILHILNPRGVLVGAPAPWVPGVR